MKFLIIEIRINVSDLNKTQFILFLIRGNLIYIDYNCNQLYKYFFLFELRKA